MTLKTTEIIKQQKDDSLGKTKKKQIYKCLAIATNMRKDTDHQL